MTLVLGKTMVTCQRPRPMLLFLFFASFFGSVSGQIGVDLCSCQPAVYEFTLDFSLTCEDQNIEGPGIQETECFISSLEGENTNITDLAPARVSAIQIIELDQNLRPLVQTPVAIDGSFTDGQTFTYTSIIATGLDALDETQVPKGFMLVLSGTNAEDEFIGNTWIVIYDNDCSIFPILFEGQRAGWTVVVRSCSC